MQKPILDKQIPEELIASEPLARRDDSRLLVYQRDNQEIKHKSFKGLKEFLRPGDILVRNISKVMPARFLVDAETGAKLEILLLKKIDTLSWEALAKPAKRIKNGRKYFIANDISIILQRNNEDQILVKFNSVEDFARAVTEYGLMPIPPYMKRDAGKLDKNRYQTIYAQDQISGASSAAPTAGLHFTEEIIAELVDYGIEFIDLTLHVGLGTFLPIKVDDYKNHKMHSEYYEISPENYQKILEAKKTSRRIIAIGTTSVRTLESIAKFGALQGETDIFIYPGYKFNLIDGMITNFHLPDSTLILLVAAFLGEAETSRIYEEAIREKYRFFSYGDCCLFI